jgi:hypothetical protein
MFSDENILCQNKWSLGFNITFIFVFLYKKKKKPSNVTYENTHIHKYINTHSQTFLFYKKININMPLKLKQLFWTDHLIITLLFVIHIVFFFS